MDVPVQIGVDAKPYLALAIRDAAITLVGSGFATLADVLASFRKRRKKIFLTASSLPSHDVPGRCTYGYRANSTEPWTAEQSA